MTLSSSWQNISWSVNGSRNRNFGLYKGHGGKTENRINLWMSIPLERWLGGTANDIRATTQILKSSGQDTQYEVGMNGNAFDRRLYWDISQELEPGKENSSDSSLNRPGFPGECFICELRLPDHRFRWKHNKLFLLLPVGYGPAFPAIVDCYTSPPT
ncbi:fimbria/pilus outer membrane usher protein [Escherichia coli]|uniref:fimbria/pilus outer membrane usher protein n=1 Tax=Escherichia coli TaxID=562 RepID=UPI0001DCA80D|nr:hypothetical protein HMPREF9346_05268 [Escherichia coli MS 119-7]